MPFWNHWYRKFFPRMNLFSCVLHKHIKDSKLIKSGNAHCYNCAVIGSGSDLRRAIALAHHRAPKCCTRRVIFSAPWSTHKQTPESGCKDTYNTSVIHVDCHHTGSSPLSKICTRYTCFCYPFSRPICRQVALSSYSICNADCHWSSPLSLASS